MDWGHEEGGPVGDPSAPDRARSPAGAGPAAVALEGPSYPASSATRPIAAAKASIATGLTKK